MSAQVTSQLLHSYFIQLLCLLCHLGAHCFHLTGIFSQPGEHQVMHKLSTRTFQEILLVRKHSEKARMCSG